MNIFLYVSSKVTKKKNCFYVLSFMKHTHICICYTVWALCYMELKLNSYRGTEIYFIKLLSMKKIVLIHFNIFKGFKIIKFIYIIEINGIIYFIDYYIIYDSLFIRFHCCFVWKFYWPQTMLLIKLVIFHSHRDCLIYFGPI